MPQRLSVNLSFFTYSAAKDAVVILNLRMQFIPSVELLIQFSLQKV